MKADTPRMAPKDAADVARRVGDHPVVGKLARGGYAASDLLHLLLALLALRVA